MLNLVSLIVGILSLVVALVSMGWAFLSEQRLRRARRLDQQKIDALERLLREERQRFSWEDIYEACSALAREIERFEPTCIVTSPGAPLMVVGLAIEQLYWWMPVHVLLVADEDVRRVPQEIDPELVEIRTSKRTYYAPKALFESRQERVVFVDDIAFDSQTLQVVTTVLMERMGLQRQDISTCVLIASKNILDSKTLDWCHSSVSNSYVHLPWARAVRED